MKKIPKIEKIKRLENLPYNPRCAWAGNQLGLGWRCWFKGYERRASISSCPTKQDFLKMIGFYSQDKRRIEI